MSRLTVPFTAQSLFTCFRSESGLERAKSAGSDGKRLQRQCLQIKTNIIISEQLLGQKVIVLTLGPFSRVKKAHNITVLIIAKILSFYHFKVTWIIVGEV